MVGVTSPGSGTHRFLNYLLARSGLSPFDIGVNFSMAAAVQHGKVAAAVAGPLGVALLSKASRPVILADCRTEGGGAGYARNKQSSLQRPDGSARVGTRQSRDHA